jgi:hypothetical protein
MTVTIGRCVLPDPSDVSSSGGTVTFSGLAYSTETLVADRAAEMQMREMQLNGLVENPDEDVFPLLWTAEPQWDGFYRVLDVTWDWVNDGSGRASVANYAVTLTRALDGANALVEMTSLSFVRTNGLSLTTATNNDVIAHPASIVDYELRFLPDTSVVRNSPDGQVNVWLKNTSAAFSGSLGLLLTPEAFYDGSCSVEYQAANSEWYPVVGRDIPSDAAGRWRLTNGCIRIAPSGTVGTLTLSVYTGTAWESVDFLGNAFLSSTHRELKLASNDTVWLSPAILRNSPDGVAIATAGYSFNSTTPVRYAVTLSVTRGTHHVEVVLQGGLGMSGLRHASATASTALATATGGLRTTSNDANGNRLVLMSAAAITNDLTDGRFYVNSSTQVVRAFAAGIELDGSSAITGNASADLLGQFIGVSNIETHVVKR